MDDKENGVVENGVEDFHKDGLIGSLPTLILALIGFYICISVLIPSSEIVWKLFRIIAALEWLIYSLFANYGVMTPGEHMAVGTGIVISLGYLGYLLISYLST